MEIHSKHLSFPCLFHALEWTCSTQPPPSYSLPSTATYSVQQASAVPHVVTASYSPASVQAARPVASSPYPTYQSHQAPPDFTYRQPDPPQPTTTPQTYQVFSDMVSLILLLSRWKCPFLTWLQPSWVLLSYCSFEGEFHPRHVLKNSPKLAPEKEFWDIQKRPFTVTVRWLGCHVVAKCIIWRFSYSKSHAARSSIQPQRTFSWP